MTKMQFLLTLHDKLAGLPKQDVEERLNFYCEMIEDRIEEGVSEEEAVAAVGSVEEIAAQIIQETSFAKIAKEAIKPKRQLKTWEILLLILGSPLWLSLVIAAGAVVLAFCVAIYCVVIALWAAFAAVVVSGFVSGTAGVYFLFCNHSYAGIAAIGAGMACVGLSMILFWCSKVCTKNVLLLTKKVASGIKNCFVKRGERNG